MNELQIQLPPLPLSQVNAILEGLMLVPLGRAHVAYAVVHGEAQRQIEAQKQRDAAQTSAQPTVPE